MNASQEPWFKEWFNSPWYTKLYQHRSEQEARQTVQLVRDVARIPAGSCVVDLCCGYGRHSFALAEHGYHVLGIDASEHLISLAKVQNEHHNVSYHLGDMRDSIPGGPYDAIFNFFTSFGYFDTHQEHQAVVNNIADHLTDHGTFVIDFLNAQHVRNNLVPESMNMIGETTIIQERWIDEPYVRKTITVNAPCSQELTYHEHVWLYSDLELESMIHESGMHVISKHGSYAGDVFDADTSQRCIIIATKQ